MISDGQHRGDSTGSAELSQENKDSGKDHGKQQVYWYAPPKIDYKRKSQSKFMADAQKVYKEPGDDEEGEKVHIPDIFEDSDSDSDSFVVKVHKLTGMGEVGQSSKATGGNSNQIWFMNTNLDENAFTKPCEDIASLKSNIPSENVLNDSEKLQSHIPKEKAVEASVTQNESPELFISDDNIIHTQESVDMEVDKIVNDYVQVLSEAQVIPEVINMKVDAQQGQGRRRSERLKKDSNSTTMEKVEKVAQKKNLEGNPSNSNSFSVLSVDEVVHITSEMGIVIEDDDFDTCNLLKDLEIARNDLYEKQIEQKVGPQTESVEVTQGDSNIPELEWLQEESSEPEDFILVESRKKKRENKRSVKISPNKTGRNKDQEIFGMRGNRGRKPSTDLPSKCSKQKKKT